MNNNYLNEYKDLEERVKSFGTESKFLINELLTFSLNEIDYEMASKLCNLYFFSKSGDLFFISIVCAGHIARVYKKLVDQEIIDKLKIIEKDLSHLARGEAETALDDIESYVDPNIRNT